ncbi:hypothetical protein APHAL10511_005488 [Amanita phalloides]|nr:hypothetical protein APHAL10511_005488 [Amanita phalloides]
MVKFTSVFFVFATLALSVVASPVEQPDVEKVKSDLHHLSLNVMSFNGMVADIHPPLSVQQAMAIRTNAVNLEREIAEITDDVKKVHHVSVSDGTDVMSAVEKFIPTIINALMTLKAKKSAFLSIPIKGAINIILPLFENLHARSTDLANALIMAAPNSLKGQAMRDKETVDAAFKQVIDYYSH